VPTLRSDQAGPDGALLGDPTRVFVETVQLFYVGPAAREGVWAPGPGRSRPSGCVRFDVALIDTARVSR